MISEALWTASRGQMGDIIIGNRHEIHALLWKGFLWACIAQNCCVASREDCSLGDAGQWCVCKIRPSNCYFCIGCLSTLSSNEHTNPGRRMGIINYAMVCRLQTMGFLLGQCSAFSLSTFCQWNVVGLLFVKRYDDNSELELELIIFCSYSFILFKFVFIRCVSDRGTICSGLTGQS